MKNKKKESLSWLNSQSSLKVPDEVIKANIPDYDPIFKKVRADESVNVSDETYDAADALRENELDFSHRKKVEMAEELTTNIETDIAINKRLIQELEDFILELQS